jgi:hypothetical protein
MVAFAPVSGTSKPILAGGAGGMVAMAKGGWMGAGMQPASPAKAPARRS